MDYYDGDIKDDVEASNGDIKDDVEVEGGDIEDDAEAKDGDVEDDAEAEGEDYDEYPHGWPSDWSCITYAGPKPGPQYDNMVERFPS